VSRYLLRRILQAILVLVGVTVIVFVMLRLLPGGPAHAILGTHYTASKAQLINAQLGLNKPLVVQYFVWAKGLLEGHLGYSYQLNEPVEQIIGRALLNSLVLVALATIEALAVAIPLGIYQALRYNSARDHGLSVVTLLLYSMPAFWLGLIVISVFALDLKVLPVGGLQTATVTGYDLGSRLQHLVLPSFVLASVQVAVWSRYMRSAMLDVLVQDYIRSARAKGLTMRQTIRKHAMRNALTPIITLIGLSLPALFGGAVIIESVFNYPGVGLAFWSAALSYDFPVLLGIVVIVATATVVGSLVADILYAVADPRVRYSRS
jgi:peptide/nickel transport system permease protein